MIRFYYLCIFVSCVFSSQILFNPNDFNSNQPLITDPHIIAIMVEFQQDSTPLTSGDGLFLDSIDIDMVLISFRSELNEKVTAIFKNRLNFFEPFF